MIGDGVAPGGAVDTSLARSATASTTGEVSCVCKEIHGAFGRIRRKQRDESVLNLIRLVVVPDRVEEGTRVELGVLRQVR